MKMIKLLRMEMFTTMAKVTCYVSHSIRGKMGKDATDEYMEENNRKAIKFGKKLKEAFPTVDFYIPGEHDVFVCLAYRNGYLNEKQILYIDCEIINSRNFLLAWSPDGFISTGMQIEIDHAHHRHIPVFVVKDVINAYEVINIHLRTYKR
jgi:hypothetical protein